VRTETGVALHPVSISSVAVELANKIFGELSEKTVMLVGAGEMAELAAQSLMQAGAHKLLIANRTAEKAASLALEYSGAAISFEAFYEMLPVVDIAICSTGAQDYVIRTDETRRAMKSRRKGPILFIDISVPRNIDPSIAKLENSFLFDIDDLDGVMKSNLREREREAHSAEAIIESETQNFIKQLRSIDIGPQVIEVKEIIRQLAVNELKRNRKRLGALNAEQEAVITEILIPALVNKLSHPLITHLRATARNEEATNPLEELRKLVRMD
jgi:glutamyl-tRNA reductase